MPPKPKDFDADFNIFVDPSCLSDPMDDDAPHTTEAAASRDETLDAPQEEHPDIDASAVVDNADAPSAEEQPQDEVAAVQEEDASPREDESPQEDTALVEEQEQEVAGELSAAVDDATDNTDATEEPQGELVDETQSSTPEIHTAAGEEQPQPESEAQAVDIDAEEQQEESTTADETEAPEAESTPQDPTTEPEAACEPASELTDEAVADEPEAESEEAVSAAEAAAQEADQTPEDDTPEPEAVAEPEAALEPTAEASDEAISSEPEPEAQETVAADECSPEIADTTVTQDEPYTDTEPPVEISTSAEPQAMEDGEAEAVPETSDAEYAENTSHEVVHEDDVSRDQLDEVSGDVHEEAFEGEDAETPRPSNASDYEHDTSFMERSCPPDIFSDRKTSLRTEALIHAAARAVVARIEERSSRRGSMGHEDEEADHSILSTGTQDTYGADDARSTYSDHHSTSSRRGSSGSQLHHTPAPRSISGDEGGDSSSHHEAEDDVFSDRSARSSIGSFDGNNDTTIKNPLAGDRQGTRQSSRSSGRSPRRSSVSMISDISQYDKEDFVPTNRDARLPFRTPSAVRAIQMNSPSPSVYNGGSPRSNKRQTGNVGGMLPTISRLGSPAQYSPKGRTTPTRFKSRKEAPLNLLHVTLLPLEWLWSDVLKGLDTVNDRSLDKGQQPFEVSEQLKTLRDSWQELQDSVGNTVLERGILLPHPQNDVEVLEERFLEALQLPQRRRARILECGHYLGPSNMVDDEDEDESEDEYGVQVNRVREEKRHWCNTCRGDIKYEDLGSGKIFRVKVYASNGLMTAGAWAACWKEMERVDIEVEPIVEPFLLTELERLAMFQMEQEEQRLREAEARPQNELLLLREVEQDRQPLDVERQIQGQEHQPNDRSHSSAALHPEPSLTETREQYQPAVIPSAAQTPAQVTSPPPTLDTQLASVHATSPANAQTALTLRPVTTEAIDMSEDRRRRDAEREREIYGDAPLPMEHTQAPPPTYAEPAPSQAPPPTFHAPPPTPRGPPAQAYGQRDHPEPARQGRSYEDATFSDLLLEAFKVLLRDPKNVVIIVLSVFVMCILVRPTQQVPAFGNDQLAYRYDAKTEVIMNTPVVRVEVPVSQVTEPLATVVAVEVLTSQVPEVSASVQLPEAVFSAPPLETVAVSEPKLEAKLEPEPVLEPVLEPEPVPELPTFIQVQETPSTIEIPEVVVDAPSDSPSIPEQFQRPTCLCVPGASVYGVSMCSACTDPGTISSESAEEFASTSVPDALESVVELETSTADHPMDACIPSIAEESLPSPEAPEPSIPGPIVLCSLPEQEGKAIMATSPAMIETIATMQTPSAVLAPEHSINTTTETVSTQPTHPCDSYVSARLSAGFVTAVAAPSPSPTPLAEHASMVLLTEKKTIRVFETITETVRVRITATETVSSVETAVPQTMEETVYETETVRVTVSLPMEEEQARVALPTCR